MAIALLYFASVREKIGTDGETIDPPAGVGTLGELIDWLASRSPAHAQALCDRSRLRAAIDQRFADFDTPVAGASEIALFPPVTGG